MEFEAMYGAVASRDRRFDGQFFTAVHTTGIYCRPSCPARTPFAQNVSFFRTSAAAQLAGFRACKRCIPEATPATPEWNARNDLASRAMRHILDGVVDREGVPGLAGRLGYSTRQLGRILTQELGAGPLALARAARAQTARQLLTETELKFSDVAFAAGFESVRQFNDTVTEVFDLTPTAIRERTTSPNHSAPRGGIELWLPYREPCDLAGVFEFLRRRAIPGVELVSAGSYSRTLRLPRGEATATIRQQSGKLRLSAQLENLGDLPVLLSRMRRLFDLDADPVAIDESLSTDARLRERVRQVPGIRVPGAVDAEELLFRAIVGQQVTVASGLRTLSALATLGSELAGSGAAIPPLTGLPRRLFPSAAQIAAGARSVFRGPASRLETIERVAEALAAGDLVLSSGDNLDELRSKLLGYKGIGPWTADYVAMRLLGDPDLLLTNDAAVRAGAKALGLPAELTPFAERFAPWRSYLTLHLWRAADPASRHRLNESRPKGTP
jgi:AraC family transcriptional regulator of adaptative response / DNA-3-methyladenine glycosylase II